MEFDEVLHQIVIFFSAFRPFIVYFATFVQQNNISTYEHIDTAKTLPCPT